MRQKITYLLKTALKTTLIFCLVFVLAMSNANSALAARSGGRIGGGSFRMPSRTYTTPRGGGYSAPRGYGYGGGFGFPFLLPFFGFGGFGSLFTILIFFAVVNFLVRSFRSLGEDSGNGGTLGYGSPSSSKVSVGKVQVGLLAGARSLQTELDDLARQADTGTPAGRAKVVQEATLALLRHPEYWMYGAAESSQAALDAAEAKYNQLALTERSKFTEETLSNVNSQLRQALKDSSTSDAGELAQLEEPDTNEYIVVTIVVGAMGKLELPKINDSGDMQQALKTIGGLASDRLLAVEVLWTPQAQGDTLTKDDILAEYPDLKLV